MREMTKKEIENKRKEKMEEYESKKKEGKLELNEQELENITGGGFTVWYKKENVEFKFHIGDEVEVCNEPYVFRWTTKRVRISRHVYMNYTDDNTWGPAYEGYEVDGGKFREFCEWEIEGCDH